MANLNKIPNLIDGLPDEISKMEEGEKKRELIHEYQTIKLKQWKLTQKGILLDGTYEPFTSKQRMIVVNNFEKAKTRKGFNLKEHIPMMVSIGALVILIVCLMIFWGDIAQPALTSKAMTKEIVDMQNANLQILREIKLDVQTIKGEDGG